MDCNGYRGTTIIMNTSTTIFVWREKRGEKKCRETTIYIQPPTTITNIATRVSCVRETRVTRLLKGLNVSVKFYCCILSFNNL